MATGIPHVPVAVSNALSARERAAVPKPFEPWFSVETAGLHLVLGYQHAAQEADEIHFLGSLDAETPNLAMCVYTIEGLAWPDPPHSFCAFITGLWPADISTEVGKQTCVALAELIAGIAHDDQTMDLSNETQGDCGVRP